MALSLSRSAHNNLFKLVLLMANVRFQYKIILCAISAQPRPIRGPDVLKLSVLKGQLSDIILSAQQHSALITSAHEEKAKTVSSI
jgi:hypothetical protein